MNRKNRFYYYYRLFKWKILRDRSPAIAAIKVTQRCNLKCKHCPWSNKITRDLPLSDWKSIINDLYDQGVSIIVLEGGEPTLFDKIKKLVDYIKSKNIHLIYITNGTLDISAIDPDVFWVSIDGMRKSHNMIRGDNVFEKVITTLKKNPDKKFISLTTISKTNVDDIEKICEYFSSNNLVSGLMFNFEYAYDGIKDVALNRTEKKRTARKLIKLKKKYPIILNSESFLKLVGEKKKCYPWLLVSVTADGKQRNDCMIRHIEEDDCSKCDMCCYGELSRMYELKKDTAKFFSKSFDVFKCFE
jgi:MoaA/NifB/PqqE/SkfB family radical SAM enzyme